MLCLSDKIGSVSTLCGGRFDTGLSADFDAAQKPYQIGSQITDSLQPLQILCNIFGAAAVYHIPVSGRCYRHLVDGEVFIQCIQRSRGAGAACRNNGGGRLMTQMLAAGIKQPIHEAKHCTVGRSIVNRTAEHKTVCILTLKQNII